MVKLNVDGRLIYGAVELDEDVVTRHLSIFEHHRPAENAQKLAAGLFNAK